MAEHDQTQDMPPDLPLPEFQPRKKLPGRVGTTIGDYEVDGELGRGGMGIVYRARQKELNRLVALKMLTGHYGKEELQRFLGEAQIAAGLHHTNIVHIYEVGDFDGAPYFSMEFVEGGTLAERLKKSLPTPREAAELLMPVARALHFAHQRGVVHRDMKPHNILIDPDGEPKVADFGIAKRMDDDSALTRSGAVIGTPTYMAPEQARGTSRDVGPGADIYSLGAILYEMLTGRPPFLPEESDTPLAIRVITEDTPSPASHRSEIPREIVVICMKCLQKDPRDRYSSAAAFAEDLRRYLDDEGILARPPSRLVMGLKWVRRNPWRFTFAAAGLLLAVLGGHRAWQWENFERLRIEHAAAVEYVNGALEPSVRVSDADAIRRAVTLQLTRRGRRGPVTKIEVLNPRGRPATIRRLLIEEPIPLYAEGITGVQPLSEKSPESPTVEQVFDGSAIREVIGRDRDGAVNWRILYDRQVQSGAVVPVFRARFTNLRGLEKGGSRAATLMEFERDANGRDVHVAFYNSGGKPAANGDGVFGYRFIRNDEGRVVQFENLGVDGRPAANRAGLTAGKLVLAPTGQVVRFDMLDAAGNLAPWNGVASAATEYDAAGNAVRVRRLGSDQKPARLSAQDWIELEIVRNQRGEITARKYDRGEGERLAPLSEQTFAYDENGHPTEVRFSGIEKWRTVLRHDPNGNVIEERFFDGEDLPRVGKAGYSARRISYQQTPQGLRTEDTYFDGADQPTYNRGGYRKLVNDYDATGMLRRQAMEDHDPQRFGYYRFVSLTDYDLQGRLQNTTNRFEDEQGQLVDAEKAGLRYHLQEEGYDDNGREIVTWQFGWSRKDFGASIWRKETAWYPSGMMRSVIWQACDENRKPLPKIANLDPARTEEDFDSVGKIERKLEADFDEDRLGFASRELFFIGGRLQRVVHRTAAGEELKDIRVFVTAITSDAQARSQELKVGDQLATANGEPVGSAYEWMLSLNFAGGYVDIVRDGRPMRIDGFEPGKLGVLLQDRGPGVP